MKSEQKVAILIWHWTSKSRKKDGKAPIYIRITIEGEEEEISTGKVVHPNFWDGLNKKCLPGADRANEINAYLEEAVEDLEAHFRILRKKYETVTSKMLKRVYKGLTEIYDPNIRCETGEEITHTILEVANLQVANFAEEVEEDNKSSFTLKQWRATTNKIKEFCYHQYRRIDMPLKSLKDTIAIDFYTYLTVKRRKYMSDPAIRQALVKLDPTEGTGKIKFGKKAIGNLSESAARKQVKNLKQILKLAVKQKWLATSPVDDDFKCSGGEKDVIPLELDEVYAIYSKRIDIPRLVEARDAFIVQVFTGFAYQDIYALGPENIRKIGRDRTPWLIKGRGKTDVDEMVPILPIVAELIKKYENHPYCKANNRLFPVNSNSNYNGYLKEIATICGVDRVLKTHLARHTFADIMLNVCNIPLEDVSKMLGHKSIRTTTRYCRVRKKRINENMKEVGQMLFTKNGELKQIA